MSKKIVGYFGSWSVYRPDSGKFDIDDIDPRLFTHLIWAFVGLDGDDVKVLDPWRDLPDNGGKNGFGRFNDLRKTNRRLKTMVAIGGYEEGSKKYSTMAADPASRSRFVRNAVRFVKKHNFDGLDVDWEYPGQRGGSSSDIQNFTALVKELKRAFDAEGLVLSAAVAAAESSASRSYEIAKISRYLDFINLMAYDLHGSWENRTGFNAPLKAGSSDTGDDRKLTVDASVKYWISQGANPEKLVLGIATYGRSFTLARSSDATKVGARTTGPGIAGPYTGQRGMLGYNEIRKNIEDHGWSVDWDAERLVPLAYHNDQWVGYDNRMSVKAKARYVMTMKLGGAMVWSIETDDFRGLSGQKYPLIKKLREVLSA